MKDEQLIQSVAEAVVNKLEPVLLERFGEISDRLSRIELQVAPVAGRTVHDIKNHLAAGAGDLGRLSDSYERLVEVLNVGLVTRQAHIKIIRRLDEVEQTVARLSVNRGEESKDD